MRRKNNKYLLLLALLLLVTVGYALISTTLKITGNATITKQTWDVYWGVPTVTEGSKSMTAPIRGEDSGDPANTKLTWSVTLDLPGDFYEFTVDAVNNGSIDAMITGLTPTVNPAFPTNPDYIKYSVTYDDGIEPALNHLLAKKTGNTPTTEKYKVRVYYDEAAATATTINSMTGNTTYTFTLDITYGQATDEAIPKPIFKLGDYFTLVPDETTATTSVEGFSGSTPTSDQTLWRVIDIHQDRTVDAVSEYVSTNDITISGVNGYKNYVAGLQDIASKYAKSGYTVGTRMMGYDGQTLVIQDTSAFDGTLNPIDNPDVSPPSTAGGTMPTTGIGEEYMNGVTGDTLYLKDFQLVGNLYSSDSATYGTKGLNAYDKTGTAKYYWLASRYYSYFSGSRITINYGGRIVDSYDNFGAHGVCIYNSFWSEPWRFSDRSYPVRPIITLRDGVVRANGTGTKTDPYTFQ